MRERIGVIGLGLMGSTLASRAATQGFQTIGWSRSGGDRKTARHAGFRLASKVSEVVAEADILLLSLLDGRAVDDLLTQLAQFDLSGKLIVETSTVSPDIVRENETSIKAAAGTLIDAPISGGPEMVANGTMGLFIGGENAAVARFMKIAPEFSDRIAHIGGLGAGAAAKIVNNVATAGAFGATVEAVLIGQKLGLDLRNMMDFLENSPGITPMVKSRIPAILGDDDTVGFSIKAALATSAMFLEEAKRLGLEVPALAAQFERTKSAHAAGLGDCDYAAVLPHVLEY